MEAEAHNKQFPITSETPMRTTIIAALMLASASVQAQDSQAEFVQQQFRFQFYTTCAPVHLNVLDVDVEAEAWGLTKDAITTTVRSRLRAARIYTSEVRLPSLNVEVAVLKHAFSLRFSLMRILDDPEYVTRGFGYTWFDNRMGIHTEDHQGSNFILQEVGHLTDQFIDQYLAVNESACK